MLYMVLERYKDGAAPEIYRRARERGRLMPEGLRYVASWVDHDFQRCFQIMETEDASLFDPWIQAWADLVEFEVIPVRTSAEAAQIMKGDA
jgi:Protein of unknown function (DUF3303)